MARWKCLEVDHEFKESTAIGCEAVHSTAELLSSSLYDRLVLCDSKSRPYNTFLPTKHTLETSDKAYLDGESESFE